MASVRSGGWTEWTDADEKVKSLCWTLKPEVEEKTGKTFTVFEALMYRTQIVEGTKYGIKVDDHISAAEVLLAEQ
ncbi:hypothetical protein MHYP_G00346910 [Metynnis hypsauchen]